MGNLKETPWTEVIATLEALAYAGWTREDLKLLRKDGKRALKALNAIRVWKTWKTIRLGTGLKTANDFRKALKASGFQIGNWANDILGKPAFTAASKETKLELVRVSVGELGFKNRATREEIYQRAQELGLKICPNEVGPQLRLQYKDQPNGEWLLVAMEPITDFGGRLGLFSMEYNDVGRWLSSDFGDSSYVWQANNEFVFCN